MLKHVPNILTVIRLLLIPFIVFFILTEHYILAFIFFTISGITDIADGFIARKFNLVSTFGKLMDPLADKLTQIATIASLVFTNIIANCISKRVYYDLWCFFPLWQRCCGLQ